MWDKQICNLGTSDMNYSSHLYLHLIHKCGKERLGRTVCFLGYRCILFMLLVPGSKFCTQWVADCASKIRKCERGDCNHGIWNSVVFHIKKYNRTSCVLLPSKEYLFFFPVYFPFMCLMAKLETRLVTWSCQCINLLCKKITWSYFLHGINLLLTLPPQAAAVRAQLCKGVCCHLELLCTYIYIMVSYFVSKVSVTIKIPEIFLFR